MSHYPRGILDGVVHYCDKGHAKKLWSWCRVEGFLRPMEAAAAKRAMVTCLRCLWLRQRRPNGS